MTEPFRAQLVTSRESLNRERSAHGLSLHTDEEWARVRRILGYWHTVETDAEVAHRCKSMPLLARISKAAMDVQCIQKRLKLPDAPEQPIEQAVKTALKTAEDCLWQYMKHIGNKS